MNLKFCSCRGCKKYRHKKGRKDTTERTKRAARRRAKQMIKQGKWEEAPESVSIPYTY